MDIEKEIKKLYEKHRKTASRFGYTYKRATVSLGSLPCVFFLGNHSSGKSTFINHLLGGEPVQDTGVAPTDDGFTFLLFGEEERDAVGLAALSLLPEEAVRFKDLGENFLQRLRVKVRNREILRKAVLVDSPGMIDSGEEEIRREYDFFGALRDIAEVSDLVVMMFDPDKPGTTGEAVSALTGPISGMIFKLRILMNKCDLFAGMNDYARAYGALCWNLAHALSLKDMPKILACRVPVAAAPEPRLPMDAFDASRNELVSQIEHASERRRDNVIGAVHKDFTCLLMQMRMLTCLKRKIDRAVFNAFGINVLFALAFAGTAFFAAERRFAANGKVLLTVTAIAGIAALFAGILLCRWIVRILAERLIANIDEEFEEEYRYDIGTDSRDDLRQCWELVRPTAKGTFALRWKNFSLPWFADGKRKKIERDLAKMEASARENV